MKPKAGTIPQKNSNEKYIYIIIVLFITIFTYSNSIHNGFVSFDDTGYITNNNLIKSVSKDNIIRIFTPTPYGFVMGNYHPLVELIDAIIYQYLPKDANGNLLPNDPSNNNIISTPYHEFNLLIHLINVVLIFIFIKQFTKRNLPAALAAAIFSVHPLHVENVAWVSDLKDLLYTAFYVGALLIYIKYLKNDENYQSSLLINQNNKQKVPATQPDNSSIFSGFNFLISGKYWICFLLFIMSLLSKPSAITLPAVLLLFDLFSRKLNRNSIIKIIIEKIPFFVLSLVFGNILLESQAAAGAIVKDITFNMDDRFFMFCKSVVYYLRSFFVPYNLANLHPFPVKIDNHLPLGYYLSPVILLVLFGVITWFVIRFNKYRNDIIFGLLFFFITISLLLQFKPFGFAIVSERYTYLPYVGLLLILVKFYDKLIDVIPKLKINLNIGIMAVIFIFCIVSFQRNKAWKNSIDLLVDLTQKYPKFAMAYDDLGVARMLSSDLEGAITEFNKALEIDPKYYYSNNNRGEARRYLNDQEGAWKDYNRAIQLFPLYSDAYNNRAIIKFNRKDYIGSIVDCSMSIMLKPDNPNAYNNRASSRISLNDYAGAFRDYNSALKLNPYYADGYKNRGIARFYQRDIAGACNDWKKANELGNTQASQLIQTYCK